MLRIASTIRSAFNSTKLAWLAILLTSQLSALGMAQYGNNMGAFATRGARGRTPLSVKYTLDLPPSMSFGVVTVDIADTTGPSKVDRDLSVVLYTKNWGQGTEAIAIRQSVRLAEGQSKTQLEIPFVAIESQLAWDVGVFENGRDIEDKRNRPKSAPNESSFHWTYNANTSGNSFLVAGLVASDANANVESQNLKVVSDLAESLVKNANGMGGAPAAAAVMTPSSMVAIDKASYDWRYYLPYSVWIISADAVAEINVKQPRVASAVRTYVSAGGRLLVYGVHNQASMATVNQLLSESGGNAELAAWRSFGKSMPAWWITNVVDVAVEPTAQDTKPAPQSLNGTGAAYDAALLTDTLLETGFGTHRDNVQHVMDALGFENLSLQQLEAGREQLWRYLGNDRMLIRNYARGQVLVCSKALHELPSSQIESIVKMENNLALSKLTARSNDGNWFWQNLILEVGKPPVWAFCVMVTLFGALLGPGLLFFTGRIQRRSLMIFLVPTVSLVATLAIVVYGVFHEGFDTHIRIHSVTAYDGPAQVAFGWSRQNYFSGSPPREGLQFPRTAYVRTVVSEDENTYSGTPDPRRNINTKVAVGEFQTWTEWLEPRQHQQLLVGHAVDAHTQPISTERSAAGNLKLTNLTDSKLPVVILRGGQDDYYVEVDLGPQESRESTAQDRDSVAIIVGRIGADYRPKIPAELDGGSDSLLNFGNARRYTRSYQYQAADIIDEALKRNLTDELTLEPHAFATLVPEFSAIAVPLTGFQSDNVNLVIGVDPW